jgi:putative transposase
VVTELGIMTAPREVIAGRTYLITRRCTQRQFLLTPSNITNQIIRYCLALAANATGIRLHAYCFMSNHWHGVVTDTEARLPEFLERFHRLLARAQNAVLGRHENFWSSEKPSAVYLVSEPDIIQAIAYTIANPVAAGLVPSPSEWPGVLTQKVGESSFIDKPTVFFAPRGRLPSRVELRTYGPGVAGVQQTSSMGQRLREALRTMVSAAHSKLGSEGVRFVGAAAILRQSTLAMPSSIEEKRTTIPKFAAGNRADYRSAMERLRQFVLAYRLAWEAWRSGFREALFPAGTYALRIYARVACAPAVPLSA